MEDLAVTSTSHQKSGRISILLATPENEKSFQIFYFSYASIAQVWWIYKFESWWKKQRNFFLISFSQLLKYSKMNHSETIDDDKETIQTLEQTNGATEEAPVKKTFKDRTAFLKDPRFYKVLVLGQGKWRSIFTHVNIKLTSIVTVLSLCITGTNVTTTKLGMSYNFAAPTTQTFLV